MVAFGRELRADGALVRMSAYGGKHNWTLWRAHFSEMLRYAGGVLEARVA
jgi:enterochelin esterase-like enzyme